MLSEFWEALNLELRVFYGIGLIALFGLLIQLLLSLFGGMDEAADIHDGDHGSGLGILSVRGVIAFFTGFGWAGVIAIKSGLGLAAAITIAVVVGTLLMVGIFLLMRSMLRLQSNGTIQHANAVGEIATVYVTIPASRKAGGQVEILLQGRLTMADAVSSNDAPLVPGTKVRVIEKIGHATLIVEPLS